MSKQPKKLVEAQLLSDNDNEDGFEKGCALIRANLGVDPTNATYEDWAANYAAALWLEDFRQKRLEKAINKAVVAAFGGEKGK